MRAEYRWKSIGRFPIRSKQMSEPLVFAVWQPILTDHMVHTLLELRHVSNAQMSIYVCKYEDHIRKGQGWTVVDTPSIKQEMLPTSRGIRYILEILRKHRSSIHLFGSPFEQPIMMLALLLASLRGFQVYLISEPYSPISDGYFDDRKETLDWIKGKLRPIIYHVYGLILRKRIAGVFAISPRAVSQYQRIGIPTGKVFPFGYFVPVEFGKRIKPTIVEPANASLRMIFVGSLIRRKGLMKLIDSVRSLRDQGISISLDAYGPGNPDVFPFDDSFIRYAGVIPFGGAQEVIARYDLLVLPSNYDGWGVVVNEAIMSGTPVVCSDKVGAGAIIKQHGCGIVFDDSNNKTLTEALKELALDRAQLAAMKQSALETRAVLSPIVAGQYILDSINSSRDQCDRPPCPWYSV